MTVRGICHVRPWSPFGEGDLERTRKDPRFVRATGWLGGHPVTVIVFWDHGEQSAAHQRPAYRPLTEIVAAAARERHPQLTELPHHEHGDVFCYAWGGCFCFVPPGCPRVDWIRAALAEEDDI